MPLVTEDLRSADTASKPTKLVPAAHLSGALIPLPIAVLLVGAIAILAIIAWSSLQQEERQLAKAQELLANTDAVLGAVTDAETGQRGYLLTRDPRYLDSYHAGSSAVQGLIEGLRRTAAGEPEQLRRIDVLDRLSREKMSELAETVALTRSGDLSGALAVVQTDRGRQLMNQIRSECAQIQSAAGIGLSASSAQRRQSQFRLGLVSTAGSGVICLMLAVTTIALYRGLIRRYAAERELQRTATRLAAANRELENFAHSVAHDLRSPLRNVSTMVDLLTRRLRPHIDANAAELVDFIKGGVRQMESLISGLLDFARSGGDGDAAAPTDCNQVMESVLNAISASVTEAGASITVDPLPVVMANFQIARVFQNLLENALKYRGSDPPRIQIRAERSGAFWLFRVEDNGIGFDPANAERIFEPFVRLEAGPKSGAGIGLATCKRVVEHLNGRMWAVSSPGRGATFFFTLPAA